MGVYKFWNPATSQYEIIKSKSIIKDDGSLEYTPDDIKAIDNEVASHKDDSTAHGIGDKATLLTANKSTIVGAMNELFQNVSNGKGLIATAVTGKGVVTSGSDTFSTMATKIDQINTDPSGDATAVAGDILSGKTAYKAGVKLTGTIPSKTAQTFTPSKANQTIAAGQYLSGTQTIKGDSDLVAANIKAGVNIFGVTGNLAPAGVKRIIQGWDQSNASTTNKVIPAVELANTIVLTRFVHKGRNEDSAILHAVKLTSPTNLQINRSFNPAVSLHYTVIEFMPGVVKSIQRGDALMVAADITISPVVVAKSMVIITGGQRIYSSGNSNGDPTNVFDSGYGTITSTTNLNITIAGSSAKSANGHWQVIEFN